MKVWQFSFEAEDRRVEIRMPEGARILTVQTQGNRPCIWALVEEGKPLVVRRFHIYEVGQTVSSEIGDYVGTYQLEGGARVLHMFEIMQ